MKKLLVLSLLLIGASAQALDPKDVFGTIFDIIVSEINKDQPKPGKPIPPTNDGVILKDSGDKIVLGRLKINENKTMDTVRFPDCVKKGAGNKRVSRVRFYVNEADVDVNTVTVTFQNDESKVFKLGQVYADGDASGWLTFRNSPNGRCIKKISVEAELDSSWGNWNNGNGGWNGNGNNGNWGNGPKGPGGPGNGGPGGWNNNNWNNGDDGFGPQWGPAGKGKGGGKPNKNERAILSFVGQKI